MLWAYPQPGKAKAIRLCEAFVEGVRASGGQADICLRTPNELKPGDCIFYGVRPGWAHLFEQCVKEIRTYYWLDNSWFDCTRERYFRAAKNRMQHDGRGESDGERFKALGLTVKPWRNGGDYALVCPQSDEFMRVCAGDPEWLARTTAELRLPFVVRRKGTQKPFADDLSRARCVITWSSAAAANALVEGVPVVCSDQCAAYGVTDRQKWANVLADQQWSLEEIARGMAWQTLEPVCSL